MSISSVTSTPTTTGQTSRPDPMSDVAQLLNMSPTDLRTALQSGSSLSDLASKQGVSRDDLLNTIETDLKNRPARPAGSTDGTSSTTGTTGTDATSSTQDLAALAAKIADSKGGGTHHHGHHHHGGGSAALTPTTSDASTVSDQLATGGSVDVTL